MDEKTIEVIDVLDEAIAQLRGLESVAVAMERCEEQPAWAVVRQCVAQIADGLGRAAVTLRITEQDKEAITSGA